MSNLYQQQLKARKEFEDLCKSRPLTVIGSNAYNTYLSFLDTIVEDSFKAGRENLKESIINEVGNLKSDKLSLITGVIMNRLLRKEK
jgi:hypothetical protein